MTGPSAIGSENGTPSSITSAPAAASACMMGTVSSGAGSPAAIYGISAARPAARSRAKVVSIRFKTNSSPRRITLGAAIELQARSLCHGAHVLVAAARKIDQQGTLARQGG